MKAPESQLVNPTKKCDRCNGTGRQPDPVLLGKEMRQYRKGLGVRLIDVARRMNVSSPYISDLELGKRYFNPGLITNFRKACQDEASRKQANCLPG